MVFLWSSRGPPYRINLTEQVAPKTIKMNFGAIKHTKFPFGGYYKILA